MPASRTVVSIPLFSALAAVLLPAPARAVECNYDARTGYPVSATHVQDYANWFTDAAKLTPPHTGIDDTVPDPGRLPVDKRAYCARSEFDIQESYDHRGSRLAFRNPAGDLGTGLCWWHSRFQRAAGYLGKFEPEKPKPSPEQVKKIISDLRSMKQVVKIPGYRNLLEFSTEHKAEITQELSRWEKHDFSTSDTWFKIRLSSSGKFTPAQELGGTMDALYERMLRRKDVVFQRHKITSGLTHSWLVLDVQPLRAADFYTIKGYRLSVIDSNFPNITIEVDYHYGETTIRYTPPVAKMKEEMFPITMFDDDLGDLRDAVKAYCKPGADS